jgi:hypothetical protein
MRAAVDLDGVCANFMGAVNRQHNEDFGTRLKTADITEWNFLPLTVFGPNDWRGFWQWAEESNIFGNCLPYPHLTWGIRMMEGMGHSVTFLTHRPFWALQVTRLWLHRLGLYQPLHLTDGRGKETFPFDLWIDDCPSILETLASKGLAARRMIRPWNRPVLGVPSAEGWHSMVRLIRKMGET